MALVRGVLSNGESLDKATVKLPDVAVEVPRLGETPFAPFTSVRLLTCVNYSVPTQVMGVLEALATLATGVWLLARVCALVALKGIHAGEGLVALQAGEDRAVGRRHGVSAVLLTEMHKMYLTFCFSRFNTDCVGIYDFVFPSEGSKKALFQYRY